MSATGTLPHALIAVRRKIAKRCFDVLFSLVVLVLCSPLFLFCMIAIRCSSRGPIFYVQPRVGLGGKKFLCWKFRTMHPDADRKLHSLLASDPALRQEWQCFYKLKNDPRVTPIGKWLRKTSLDELPQFWNTLKGDMSIVGPRPLSEEEIVRYVGKKADKLLSIRPGLTCIWAVSGRNEFTFEQRLELEERYINTLSLRQDLWLIIRTVKTMLCPKGAF